MTQANGLAEHLGSFCGGTISGYCCMKIIPYLLNNRHTTSPLFDEVYACVLGVLATLVPFVMRSRRVSLQEEKPNFFKGCITGAARACCFVIAVIPMFQRVNTSLPKNKRNHQS